MSSNLKSFASTSILALAVWSNASAQGSNDHHDRRVHIINESRNTVMELYASTINERSWEEDILDVEVIEPGASTVANIDDGTRRCLYDFKFVLEDGNEFVEEAVNVCTVEVIRLSRDEDEDVVIHLED